MKGSKRAETNARWLLLVEPRSGMKGWGNHSFYQLPTNTRTTINSSPSQTLLSLFWKGGGSKGQPPSGSTSCSELASTHSDCCLIVRDTAQLLSLSNIKQIASPWGGDYWTRDTTKRAQSSPLGGMGHRSKACGRGQYDWLLYICLSSHQKQIKSVSTCFKMQEKINFQWAKESNISWIETHTTKGCLFHTRAQVSNPANPNVLLVSSSLHHTFYITLCLSAFFLSSSCPSWPGFLLPLLKPTLLLWGIRGKWDVWTKATPDILDKASFFFPINLKKWFFF